MRQMPPVRTFSRLTSNYSRLWQGSRSKVAPPVAGATALLTLVLFRHLLIHVFLLIHLSAVAVALILLLPELLARFSDRPAFVGKVFARRSMVVFVLLSANLFVATMLALVYRPWDQATFTSESALQFFVAGALVGWFVRSLIVEFLETALVGISTDSVETRLLLSVAAYLLLFPTSRQHWMLAVPYLAGMSGGLLAHFIVRGSAHRFAREARMRQNILALLQGPDAPKLQPREATVVDCYARQQWSALRRILAENKSTMTTPMVIVQVSMERFHGNYDKALKLVNDELLRCNPKSEFVPYLQLLRALCLGDLGTDTPSMFSDLEAALASNARCVLAKSTWAVRTAEQIPLEVTDASAKRKLRRAYVYMKQALACAETDLPSVWGMVVGMWVPMTWTFLLDAYGYLAMRNGYKRLARSLFERCIRVDSKFPSPYVHLAEWYLLMAFECRTDEVVVSRNRRIATLCLNIAIELEEDRDTPTKRRSQELLTKYFPSGA